MLVGGEKLLRKLQCDAADPERKCKSSFNTFDSVEVFLKREELSLFMHTGTCSSCYHLWGNILYLQLCNGWGIIIMVSKLCVYRVNCFSYEIIFLQLVLTMIQVHSLSQLHQMRIQRAPTFLLLMIQCLRENNTSIFTLLYPRRFH